MISIEENCSIRLDRKVTANRIFDAVIINSGLGIPPCHQKNRRQSRRSRITEAARATSFNLAPVQIRPELKMTVATGSRIQDGMEMSSKKTGPDHHE